MSAPAVVVRVAAKGFKFSRPKITIAVGATVAWTFGDMPFPHNITFDDGAASPSRASGTWTRRFTKPGTYTYRCTIHPWMRGTVVVTQESAPGSSGT